MVEAFAIPVDYERERERGKLGKRLFESVRDRERENFRIRQ